MSDALYVNLKSAAAIVGLIAVVHVAANAYPLFEIVQPQSQSAPVASVPAAPLAAAETVRPARIVVLTASQWVETDCREVHRSPRRPTPTCR